VPAGVGGDEAGMVNVGSVRMADADGQFLSLDLSSLPDNTMIKGITFKTNVLTSRMLITGIQTPSVGTVTFGSELFYEGEQVTVIVTDLFDDMFDEGGGNISLEKMRSLFDSYIKVSGSLSGTDTYAGYTPYELPVIVLLKPGSYPVPEMNGWFSVTTTSTPAGSATGRINVTTKPGLVSAKIFEIGMNNLFTSILGRIPHQMRLDSSQTWLRLDGDKLQIANEFGKLASTGGGWSEVTLATWRDILHMSYILELPVFP
jgi:hypothetical protein